MASRPAVNFRADPRPTGELGPGGSPLVHRWFTGISTTEAIGHGPRHAGGHRMRRVRGWRWATCGPIESRGGHRRAHRARGLLLRLEGCAPEDRLRGVLRGQRGAADEPRRASLHVRGGHAAVAEALGERVVVAHGVDDSVAPRMRSGMPIGTPMYTRAGGKLRGSLARTSDTGVSGVSVYPGRRWIQGYGGYRCIRRPREEGPGFPPRARINPCAQGPCIPRAFCYKRSSGLSQFQVSIPSQTATTAEVWLGNATP